jgi:hypothetical protein
MRIPEGTAHRPKEMAQPGEVFTDSCWRLRRSSRVDDKHGGLRAFGHAREVRSRAGAQLFHRTSPVHAYRDFLD